MTKFKLNSEITISAYTEVEADTLEEAIEIAKERSTMEIPINSLADVSEEWIVDEIDGMPVNIHETE
jgi:hypothetical protein